MGPIVHLLVPGSLEQITGGYRYDRRVVDGLRAEGRRVVVHELTGRFPVADAAGAAALQRAARACHGGAIVVVDSLCLAAAAELLPRLRDRCVCLALVHHPASMETGLPAGVRAGLRLAERAALGAVHRVITTSPATARLLTESFGVPTTAVDVAIPGGDRGRTATRRSGAPAWRLVSVGTVSARKDHLTLVRALAQITDLRWSCDCHGSLDRDPATARLVAAEIGRLGLKSRVRLRGETGDAVLEKAYAQADLRFAAQVCRQ